MHAFSKIEFQESMKKIFSMANIRISARFLGLLVHKRTYIKSVVEGIEFNVDGRYDVKHVIGSGAYGVVAVAYDKELKCNVAIKKVDELTSHPIHAKRILREVKILRHLKGHVGIVDVIDIFPENGDKFDAVYIICELMLSDLHKVIQSSTIFTREHYHYFTYQLLCGLKTIHAANIYHRDIKPANLLVNKDCTTKITDFNLARGVGCRNTQMTEYVVTRWYRAPEIIIFGDCYDEKVDVFSVGCILAELHLRKPVFRGSDSRDQIRLYLKHIGAPEEEDRKFIENKHAKKFVDGIAEEMEGENRLSKAERLRKLSPGICKMGLDLLCKLLEFNPEKRITVDEALAHPYFKHVRDPSLEDKCKNVRQFDFSFEECLDSPEKIRKSFIAESESFQRLHRLERREIVSPGSRLS